MDACGSSLTAPTTPLIVTVPVTAALMPKTPVHGAGRSTFTEYDMLVAVTPKGTNAAPVNPFVALASEHGVARSKVYPNSPPFITTQSPGVPGLPSVNDGHRVCGTATTPVPVAACDCAPRLSVTTSETVCVPAAKDREKLLVFAATE